MLAVCVAACLHDVDVLLRGACCVPAAACWSEAVTTARTSPRLSLPVLAATDGPGGRHRASRHVLSSHRASINTIRGRAVERSHAVSLRGDGADGADGLDGAAGASCCWL